jgi:uncharacterized OB-fold protein
MVKRGLRPGSEPGTLLVPYCGACRLAHWYPKPSCPYCSGEWDWKEIDGAGLIFTFSVVRRAFSAELAGRLPLVVATVALNAQPDIRLVTNIVDCGAGDARIGLGVTPVVEEGADGAEALVNYRPA